MLFGKIHKKTSICLIYQQVKLHFKSDRQESDFSSSFALKNRIFTWQTVVWLVPPAGNELIIWLNVPVFVVLVAVAADCGPTGGSSLQASKFICLMVASQSTRGFVNLSIWSIVDLNKEKCSYIKKNSLFYKFFLRLHKMWRKNGLPWDFRISFHICAN